MSDLKTLTLGDKTYDSFPDINARKRLDAVEYQTVTTDPAYEHKDLPEEKTVTILTDNTFGNTAYINVGDDLIPRSGFNKEFPRLGITVSKKGRGYHISGTSTSTNIALFFTDENGIYQLEVPESYVGKTIKLLTFADSVIGSTFRLRVDFLDSNKANISKVYIDVAGTSNVGSKSVTIPSGAAYMQWYLYVTAKDITFDNDFQVFAVFEENSQSVVLEGETAELQNITSTNFVTFPYKSTASYIVSLNEYIRLYGGGGTVTYLTPEDFGAAGDGATDDSEAIAMCLNAASEQKKTIVMASTYFIASPILITQSGLDIIANDIVYGGKDAAIKIQGQQNTLKIHSITSGGIGIVFTGDGTKLINYNLIDVNTIQSFSHGVVFYLNKIGIIQNTIRFNYIKCGGIGCYGIAYLDHESKLDSAFVGESNFYGGHISSCEWACYKVGGNAKFYGIHVESDVEGGFYIAAGVRIIQPRFAEGARDGSYPFFKIIDAQGVEIDSSTLLPINEIDISENRDYYENALGGQSPSHEGVFGIIEVPLIMPRQATGDNLPIANVYTNKAYIWGRHLIMTPHMAYRKAITTETLDTRLIAEVKDTLEETMASVQALSQLPTKFVVDTVNTVIYLHASYCAFGFDEYEVEQANEFTCKIYDVHENLIFDGTDKGDGLYKFKVYKDADICINRPNAKGMLTVDFLGHYWEVTKSADTVI